MTHEEAVRVAKETLGGATAQEMAAFIQGSFGLAIKPAIVAVLLGTLQERAALARGREEARQKIERWKAENPREARKIAAAAKRKEAARRRNAADAGPPPSLKVEADLPGMSSGQGPEAG